MSSPWKLWGSRVTSQNRSIRRYQSKTAQCKCLASCAYGLALTRRAPRQTYDIAETVEIETVASRTAVPFSRVIETNARFKWGRTQPTANCKHYIFKYFYHFLNIKYSSPTSLTQPGRKGIMPLFHENPCKTQIVVSYIIYIKSKVRTKNSFLLQNMVIRLSPDRTYDWHHHLRFHCERHRMICSSQALEFAGLVHKSNVHVEIDCDLKCHSAKQEDKNDEDGQ